VHVLKRIHHWLQPDGKLLDVHPQPEGASVQIHADGGVVPVGPFVRPTLDEKINAASSKLAEMVQAGYYILERSTAFEIVSHHADVDAWLEYRAMRNSTSQVDPALIDRARDMQLTLRGDELLVRERVHASRYRRHLRAT
jgi:hypothetical protein